MSQKRYKLFCLKYFRAFNAFKHFFKRSKSLKIPHCTSKTILAQSRKRKYEIVIARPNPLFFHVLVVSEFHKLRS